MKNSKTYESLSIFLVIGVFGANLLQDQQQRLDIQRGTEGRIDPLPLISGTS